MAIRPLYFFNLWLVIGLALVGLTVAGSLMPSLPDTAATLNDKLLHLIVYAILGAWFGSLYTSRLRPITFLCLLGLGLECLQALGGDRHADMLDMSANALGTIIGVVVFSRYFVTPILKRSDQYLAAVLNQLQ